MRDGNLKWWCQYVVHGWAVSTSLPTPLSFLDIQILWPTSDLLRCGPETLWVNTISICVLSSPLANSGLPKWLSGKESACQCRRHFDPWVGKIPWRRKWQPTPVFLPGKSHGQRSLTGYSPKGPKDLDMTERLSTWLGHSKNCSIQCWWRSLSGIQLVNVLVWRLTASVTCLVPLLGWQEGWAQLDHWLEHLPAALCHGDPRVSDLLHVDSGFQEQVFQ